MFEFRRVEFDTRGLLCLRRVPTIYGDLFEANCGSVFNSYKFDVETRSLKRI